MNLFFFGALSYLRPAIKLTLLFVFTTIALPVSLHANATFEVIYADGLGEGFNETTTVNPIGGNSGTTLGQQRKIAFEYSLSLIAKSISSEVPIKVQATFDSLGGSASSAALGAAGPTTIHWNFNNTPQANTFFPAALANKFAGTDLAPNDADIEAYFNADVDNNVVLGNSKWYYGLDKNGDQEDTDFVSVCIHELIHGLGFLSLVDVSTGALPTCSGDPICTDGMQDIFSYFIEKNGAIPADFVAMTDQERQSLISTPESAHWKGSTTTRVTELKSLVSGAPLGKPLLYTPSSISQGSSLSHFDDSISPNALLEPFYSGAMHDFSLGAAVLSDMGWGNQVADLSFAFSDVSSSNNLQSISLITENLGPDSASVHTIQVRLSSAGNSQFAGQASSNNGTCTTENEVITCTQNTLNAGDMSTINISILSDEEVQLNTSLDITDHVEVNVENHDITEVLNEGQVSASTSTAPSTGNTEDSSTADTNSSASSDSGTNATGEQNTSETESDGGGGGGGSTSVAVLMLFFVFFILQKAQARETVSIRKQ